MGSVQGPTPGRRHRHHTRDDDGAFFLPGNPGDSDTQAWPAPLRALRSPRADTRRIDGRILRLDQALIRLDFCRLNHLAPFFLLNALKDGKSFGRTTHRNGTQVCQALGHGRLLEGRVAGVPAGTYSAYQEDASKSFNWRAYATATETTRETGAKSLSASRNWSPVFKVVPASKGRRRKKERKRH